MGCVWVLGISGSCRSWQNRRPRAMNGVFVTMGGAKHGHDQPRCQLVTHMRPRFCPRTPNKMHFHPKSPRAHSALLPFAEGRGVKRRADGHGCLPWAFARSRIAQCESEGGFRALGVHCWHFVRRSKDNRNRHTRSRQVSSPSICSASAACLLQVGTR